MKQLPLISCCCCLPRPGPSSSLSRFTLSRQLNARIDPTGYSHRSSGDKSVGCVIQANRCLTSCGEVPQSVQMSLGSPYACSPAIYGSVLTVVVRECIVVFG